MIYQLEINEWLVNAPGVQALLFAVALFLTALATIVYLLITGNGGSKDG